MPPIFAALRCDYVRSTILCFIKSVFAISTISGAKNHPVGADTMRTVPAICAVACNSSTGASATLKDNPGIGRADGIEKPDIVGFHVSTAASSACGTPRPSMATAPTYAA